MGSRAVLRLRISYWVGAVADGCVGLALWAEGFLGVESPLTHYSPEPPYRYLAVLGGSLMLGWTGLLIWADRQPVRRRDLLPITAGVILGLIASVLLAGRLGYLDPLKVGALVLFQVGLIVLFLTSYAHSLRENPESG